MPSQQVQCLSRSYHPGKKIIHVLTYFLWLMMCLMISHILSPTLNFNGLGRIAKRSLWNRMSLWIKSIYPEKNHFCRFVEYLSCWQMIPMASFHLPGLQNPLILRIKWLYHHAAAPQHTHIVLIIVICHYLQGPMDLLWDGYVGVSCVCQAQPGGSNSLLLSQLHL